MNRIKIILCAILTIAALNTYAQGISATGMALLSREKNSIGSNDLGKSKCKGGDDTPPRDDPSYPAPYPSDSTDIPVFTPLDPNEIIGTRGYDALGDTLQWVAATASLPYTIYFENDPELATAAAHKVEVRHRLHAKADISTFAIGAFGFGSHVFTVEGNRSSYQQRLDLTQDMGIYVDVLAGIDIVAGEAFWILQSIDPATGLPPQGTQQGFLPVNDENHSGEGYVSFTIKPKANACITGDELTASASIVFDINEAIPTNVWHNTVDALPPTTQLIGTDNGNNEVLLQFSGQDDEGGCGVKQYKLYVSDNYGAYSLYDTYPVGSEATFLTEYDHCYRFFCLGEDNVGNVEGKKEEAEMEYEGAAMAQSNYLSQGWNWWSTYIEQSNIDGLSMLENSLGHKGVTIKSQFDFVQNFYSDYGEDVWFGSLEGITNEQGYMIDVTEDCTSEMRGVRTKPTSHPITLQPNWNWIGYPVDSRQSVVSALSDFNASPEDLIKNQYEFSIYYDGFGWFPDDLVMNPGEGYLYYSNATGSQLLTYSNSRRDALPEKTDNRMWKTNVHAFADNLSIMAVVSIDSVEQRDENLELGAFVDGECRGSALLKHFGPSDRYYAMLSVSGQDGDMVEFGFINKEKGQGSKVSENRITFVRNGIMGSLDTPYVVNFNTLKDEAQEGSMVMFPNPVERNKTFTLNIPSNEMLKEIVIIDMLGEEVLRKTGALKPIEISGLPVAGIYVVKATTQSGMVYHGRLIVK